MIFFLQLSICTIFSKDSIEKFVETKFVLSNDSYCALKSIIAIMLNFSLSAAAGFLVFIIALAIVKYIIFAILFALSAGKLKFWIFPNLTEDVGFFESFMPVYDYTYIGGDKKKKAKDSDDEESDDEEDDRQVDEKNEEADQSESDDSTSKKSSVAGKDFELVDKNDTDA